MIGRIKGLLVEKNPPLVAVDVNGITYELNAPMSTIYELPDLGEEVCLYTHLLVREDAHLLFGFFSAREREFFRTLLKVNGVGAKIAIAILSGLSVEDLSNVVQQKDVLRITKVPGIGKKTAERLILELRDKLSVISGGELNSSGGEIEDAVGALVALGYSDRDSRNALLKVSGELAVAELIRQALRILSKV
ncbi:MAG: Holliday junction branch migration protein RuvA [Burkholderiales bacterium]|jgi:Holliday junction DNA helicase RuvA